MDVVIAKYRGVQRCGLITAIALILCIPGCNQEQNKAPSAAGDPVVESVPEPSAKTEATATSETSSDAIRDTPSETTPKTISENSDKKTGDYANETEKKPADMPPESTGKPISDERFAYLIETMKITADEDDRQIKTSIDAAMELERIEDRTRLPELYRLIRETDDFFVSETLGMAIANLDRLKALPTLLYAIRIGGHDYDGLASRITDLVEEHPKEAAPMLLTMLEKGTPQERQDAACYSLLSTRRSLPSHSSRPWMHKTTCFDLIWSARWGTF
jgi:hypothetical protein